MIAPATHLQRLAELTGVALGGPNVVAELSGAQVSFAQPEPSPCLTALPATDLRRAEALAIIEAGHRQFLRQPRDDQLGPAAQPVCPLAVGRAERMLAPAEAESRARAAQAQDCVAAP